MESIKEDGVYDESGKKDEDENLKEIIDDILKDDEVNNEMEEGVIVDNEEEVISEEEIIDDVGYGLGFFDNELEIDLDFYIDGVFWKINFI